MKIVLISLNLVVIAFLVIIMGCTRETLGKNRIVFGTSAMYPPFEYKSRGQLVGFDIELAKLIAKELRQEIVFEDMQFSMLLPALKNGYIDAAISTITITEEREKIFNFSEPYYFENMAIVFRKETQYTNINTLKGKKIGCQLGTTMEIWLKEKIPSAEIVALDNNNQAIEALKVGHIDFVLIDGSQGETFSRKNLELKAQIIAWSENGYGIVVRKNSPWLVKINQALKTLKERGEIDKLKAKWIEGKTL